MAPDLHVLGQDPAYGGGAAAHMSAFTRAATELGRHPDLVFVPHPTFAGRTVTVDRVEAVRQLRGARALSPRLREPLWVVATTAHHGYAAARSGLAYDCWLGTSLDDEWRGRAAWLPTSRRVARAVNAPAVRRLERAVLRGARRVYATSSGSRATLAHAAGLDPSQIGILPLPVDVDAFAPEPDEQWLGRVERPVVVFVGRADDPRKNVGLLLAALPLLPGVTLRLVGTPPAGPLPERVEALGQVGSVAEHVRSASLFVLPSRQEGFGIAAAEALAAGVPVVATRSGGPEELVERSGGGRLLDGWTAEELAATCRELLGDPATLLAMRRAGRDYVVREHSPERLRSLLAAALA